MNRRKRYLLPLAVVVSLMVFAGCSIFSSSEPTPPAPPAVDYPEDPDDYVLFQDFADFEPGNFETTDDITVTNPNGERGDVEIVLDSGTDSGKALHLKTVDADMNSMSVRFPKWEIPSPDVEVVAYEYKLKYVSGTAGMYLYASQGKDHRIILRPVSDQSILWTATLDGNTSTTISALKPGWNTIRVVADRTTRSGDVYINDMAVPVAHSLPFQRPVTTWEDMFFAITHEVKAGEIREAYYGDIRVWVVEQEED